MRQLDVFMGDALVGCLRQRDDGTLAFAYDRRWLARDNAMALAPSLPLIGQPHEGDAVLAYFDNLLPEGGVREFAARALQMSAENVFGLLARFGGDTAGALSLLPPGQTPSGEPRYLPASPEAIGHWFASSRGMPLDLRGTQARMSLSGAQAKMAVFIGADDAMAIPLGEAPSSHILKPSMDYRGPVPQTAVNEALVMNLAAAVGLEVPQVHYEARLDAAVVARYDRQWVEGHQGHRGHLRRLHQNDLCQILGMAPGRKYESEGGPGIAECCAAIVRHSSQPALDKKRLIEWVAFNVAVGNMDSHAKNLSLLTIDGRMRLAPFYDLLCTTVYERLSQRFAFKIGGENRPAWMMQRHWSRFAAGLETQAQLVRDIRLEMAQRIGQVLPAVAAALRAQVAQREGLTMIARVEQEVRRRTQQLAVRAAVPEDASDESAPAARPPENECGDGGASAVPPKG